MAIPTFVSSENTKVSSTIGGYRRKRRRIFRTVKRAFKYVLYETLLAKVVRLKKEQPKSNKNPEISPEGKLKHEISLEGHIKRETNSKNNLSSSSSLISSSTLSSNSSNYCPISDHNDSSDRAISNTNVEGDIRQAKKKSYFSKIVIFLIIACLLALIVWGKPVAIFCTSICLYLAPKWVKKYSSSTPVGVTDRVAGADQEEGYNGRSS